MSRHVFPLDGRRALRIEHSGGKAATLARLARLGFAVPPGIVISASMFDGLERRCAPEGTSQDCEREPEAQEALHQRLLECPLSEAERRTLREIYRRFGGPVAVRSSYVGEDGLEDSYAGQLESVLGVAGEDEFVDAVKRVYASGFRCQLASYRRARGRGPTSAGGAMSVLVQQMLEPAAGGVAFSSDPVSGRRTVIIESTAGLGDRVAEGVVTPQRYVVDARGVLTRVEAGGGEPVLEPDRVLELAALVRRIEAALSGPQDVEWVWDGENFHVLQSRPITSLAGRHIYSRRLLADMSPGLVTPLQWSTTTRSMVRHVFGTIFSELLGRRDIDPTRLITRLRSRTYSDVTLLGELLAKAGLPVNFFEVLSRDERAAHIRPRPTLRFAARSPRIAWCAVRWLRMARKANACLSDSRHELDRLSDKDFEELTPEELLDEISTLLEVHGQLQWGTVLGAVNLMVRSKLLRLLAARWVPEIDPRDLLGGDRKAGSGWNLELEAIADEARELGGDSARVMIGGDDPDIREQLAQSEAGRELAASMDRFLDRYGYFSSDATDLSSPCWREQPSLVWATVGRLAVSPKIDPARGLATTRGEVRGQAFDRLGPLQRAVFGRVWRSTSRYLDLRERLGLHLAESAHRLRRLFLTVGRRLEAEGVLDRPEEIFLLYWDEVRQVCDRTMDTSEALDLVQERLDELESDSAWEVEDTICGLVGVRDRPVEEPPPDCLSGIGSSPGQASGRACVLRDPSAAPAELSREHILIVPFTDVGWTPLLSRVGGVVAESGGILSHTSIIAREYGLPAVVNVERATSLITSGETITVDGDRGRVCFDERRANEWRPS